jgi:hypothetical protein
MIYVVLEGSKKRIVEEVVVTAVPTTTRYTFKP